MATPVAPLDEVGSEFLQQGTHETASPVLVARPSATSQDTENCEEEVTAVQPAAVAVAEQEQEEEEEEEEDIPDYWVPGEDESGLVQAVVGLPAGNYVYLHARPTGELRANFADIESEWVDLFTDLNVQGKTHAFKQSAAKVKDTSVYTVQSVQQRLREASHNEYLVVKYRDWSRWAVSRYPSEARGGFGSLKESTSALVPVVLNPFKRSYVDRFYLVCVNPGPGYFIPLTKKQYILASLHLRENILKGRQHLSEEQYEMLMEVPPEVPEVVSLLWSANLAVGTWLPSQKAFSVVATMVVLFEAFMGRNVRDDTPVLLSLDARAVPELLLRLKGAVRVSFWLAVGFLASTAGRILATRSDEALVTAETPLTALSSGLLAITSENAATLWTYNSCALLANYRFAVLE